MKNDDYLWDRSGTPDPDVQRLEKLLGELRHDRPAPEFPALVRPIRPSRLRWLVPRLAIAAAVLLVATTAWWVTRPKPAWDVETLAGAPQIGSSRIGKVGRLPVGEWLITDNQSKAELSTGVIGTVQVDPNSRLRLVSAQPTDHRLALDLGTIHARIWAPAGLFFVQTPSALAIDLGCKYSLKVDDDGASELRVTMGQVALGSGGRESFVPEGAMCLTRRGTGPGTPFYEDASEALKNAVQKLDFEPLAREQRAAELATVLKESRPRDTLTLWHLLSRVQEAERGAVYDRLATLAPPPAGVTRDGILRRNQDMLDAWWTAMDPKHRRAFWWRWWRISTKK